MPIAYRFPVTIAESDRAVRLEKMIDWAKMTGELKRDEGFRACVYQCTAGKQTVGYGHNLEDTPMSERVAEILLIADYMLIYEQLCEFDWFLSLDDLRKRVIINMAYNLGVTGVLKFKKMIEAIHAKDYQWAADEMVDSRWYQQVGDRAVRLENMMRDGA